MADYLGWNAQPRQYAALTCPADDLLFGGARGGGKSDFLLGDALNRATQYGSGFRGIVFRRSFPELEEFITRSLEIFSGLGEYKVGEKTWHFYGGGTLKMRFIESDKDVYSYQGHQYCWQGWDEIGLYPTPFAYDYLYSCLRSPYGVPCVRRVTGNPGGPGHGWLKARFIDGKRANTLYFDADGRSSIFIPSFVEDNRILMEMDPNYVKRLDSLPELLKRAFRYGDWDVFAGQTFSEWRSELHVMRPIPLGNTWAKFTSMDWGYAKPFSIGWWAVNGDGRMVRYREWYGCEPKEPNVGLKMGAPEVAKRAFEISAPEGVDQMVADPAVWSKIDDTPSIADKFTQAGWKLEKADNDRLQGLYRIHELLQARGEDGRPMLMAFESCRDFRRTLPLIVQDPRKPEDVDTNLEDHIYDETRYAAMSRFARNPRLVRTRDYLPSSIDRNRNDYDPLRAGLRN